MICIETEIYFYLRITSAFLFILLGVHLGLFLKKIWKNSNYDKGYKPRKEYLHKNYYMNK